MANIFKTSIGKKLIMSITGLFLVIFMLLHTTINFFAVLDSFRGAWPVNGAVPEGINGWFGMGCEFMALPIVNVMVPVLALGFLIHIAYGLILSISNYKARGGFNRYEVNSKAKTDSVAAKNMIYLGLIVLGLIAMHLTHFWKDMQLQEFKEMAGAEGDPKNPYMLLERTFADWWMVCIYIVWFIALYMHIGHGFWSAMQSMGLNNTIWLKRWKWFGRLIGALIVLGLTAVAVVSFCHANNLCGLQSGFVK